MVFPWIQFLSGEKKRLADIEYMAIQAFNGNVVQVSGEIDAVNDTIERIVPNGKTAYMAEAKIVITGHDAPTDGGGADATQRDMVEADLLIDGVKKDTTNIGTASQSSFISTSSVEHMSKAGFGNIGDGRFNVLGLKLQGDGAKKIEIKNIVDNGTAHATMTMIEVDTANSPAV